LVTIELFIVPGPNMPVGALRLLQQLQDRHPARVRLVYRVLKSGASQMVSSATLEAHAQGKFFEMMDELGKLRGSALKKEDLYDIARKIGGARQRAAAAIQLDRYRDVIDANQHRFDRLHAVPTPSLLFNSRPPKGALGTLTLTDLEREYDAAFERAIDKI